MTITTTPTVTGDQPTTLHARYDAAVDALHAQGIPVHFSRKLKSGGDVWCECADGTDGRIVVIHEPGAYWNGPDEIRFCEDGEDGRVTKLYCSFPYDDTSVADAVVAAFAAQGFDVEWNGTGEMRVIVHLVRRAGLPGGTGTGTGVPVPQFRAGSRVVIDPAARDIFGSGLLPGELAGTVIDGYGHPQSGSEFYAVATDAGTERSLDARWVSAAVGAVPVRWELELGGARGWEPASAGGGFRQVLLDGNQDSVDAFVIVQAGLERRRTGRRVRVIAAVIGGSVTAWHEETGAVDGFGALATLADGRRVEVSFASRAGRDWVSALLPRVHPLVVAVQPV